MSLEAQAATLGIPLHIQIDNDTRYSDCVAHAANLVSIEGRNAVYKGECGVGHQYENEFTIEELRNMARIENGSIVYGTGKTPELPSLGEF